MIPGERQITSAPHSGSRNAFDFAIEQLRALNTEQRGDFPRFPCAADFLPRAAKDGTACVDRKLPLQAFILARRNGKQRAVRLMRIVKKRKDLRVRSELRAAHQVDLAAVLQQALPRLLTARDGIAVTIKV